MSEEKKYLMTEEGRKQLQEEYDHLIHVDREENKRELAEARAMGDLSENADYDAAREKQGQIEGRIAALEDMLQEGHYEIITKGENTGVVKVGFTVVVESLDTHEVNTYTIVGSTEADPLNGRISNETPLAKAIMGKGVNEEAEVNARSPYMVKILAIH
jgi:transcription elongation factor GreA